MADRNQTKCTEAVRYERVVPVNKSFIVCEPQPLMLQALLGYLEDLGHTVVTATTDIHAAIEAIEAQQPDVLLLGIERSGPELSAIQPLCAPPRRLPVLVFGPDHAPTIVEAIRLDAGAYVLRTAALGDLAVAIDQMMNRTVYLRNPWPELDVRSDSISPLTQKEADLLMRLASSGAKTAELATDLGVAEQTVKFHLTNIYRKLGVANRTEATVWARTHGFV
jgi:DNA-binding NarL/FixJ family response regulator